MYRVRYVLSRATLPLISNKNEYTTFVENPKRSLLLSTGLLLGRWLYTAKYAVLCVASILKCFYICVFPYYNKLIRECIVHHTHKEVYMGDLLLHICIFCCSSFCSHNGLALYSWQPLLIWLSTLVAYALLWRQSSPNLWGQEGQGLELLPVPTRILLDKWPASRAV